MDGCDAGMGAYHHYREGTIDMQFKNIRVPKVGLPVHYVSRGSKDGKFAPEHRAAVITELYPSIDSEEEVDRDFVGLCVLNPGGIFFDPEVRFNNDTFAGGTWHWIED